MTIGERIKLLRDKKGITQTELAEITDTTKQNIYKYENGIVTNIPSDKIEAIAEYFKVSPSYLMGWDDTDLFAYSNIFPIKTHKVPMLGEIACGKPIYADEDRESYVEVGTDIKCDFCLKAKGDSMINARIYDGDVVFIRKQSMVENGEIAAVIIDGEATLKRVYYYPDKAKLILSPENTKYEPYVYVGEELNDIQILGKAIAFQSDL